MRWLSKEHSKTRIQHFNDCKHDLYFFKGEIWHILCENTIIVDGKCRQLKAISSSINACHIDLESCKICCSSDTSDVTGVVEEPQAITAWVARGHAAAHIGIAGTATQAELGFLCQ